MEKNNATTFLHLLVFRCRRCGCPICTMVLSPMRSLEAIHAGIFKVKCECGWLADCLGMQARNHFVDVWSGAI